MVLTSKLVLPIVLGISLCSVSAILLYILLKKDEDEFENPADDTESSQFSTKEIIIPKGPLAAAIIGRGGSNIKELEQKTGARIMLSDQGSGTEDRICTIRGPQVALTMAENLIQDIIQQQKNMESVTISVPHWATGKIIGRGGENINNISHVSGAKINISANKDKGTAIQKTVVIKGNPLQIRIASDMIEKCVSEVKHNRENEAKNREPRGKYATSETDNLTVSSGNPGTKGSCPQNAPPAGSSGALLEVFVSAVSSPSRFWLQIIGPQVEELDKLVNLMTEFYNNADNRELHKLSDINVGQMVAAVFRYDGKWYRAKVIEIKPHEFDPKLEVCDLHFVDYGDNEYVAKHELLSLRTDMLTLRYQAVECFLAEVSPAPETHSEAKDGSSETLHHNRWANNAIERFEELTHVAKWKRLWSRTCTFKERTVDSSLLPRSSREGSPIPGVKLYDTIEGKDIDIGQVMIDEGLAVAVENDPILPKPVTTTPLPTPTALIPPPTFGDLECSRVLGMVTNREERASSLPHGGSSPSTSPHFDHKIPDNVSFQPSFDNLKPKSTSLAAGMDHNINIQPRKSPSPSSITDLSYVKPEVNGKHVNGSPAKSHHNGDFLNSERVASSPSTPQKPKPQPLHMPDPKDELKAKMNRVDSHHGSLEAMVKHTPPPSIVNLPVLPKSSPTHEKP